MVFSGIPISDEVLNHFESGSYLENKMRHNSFFKDNPFVARKKIYIFIFQHFKLHLHLDFKKSFMS